MIENLISNIEKLTALYEQEKSRREALETEKAIREAELIQLKREKKELETKIANIRLMEGFIGTAEKKAAAKDRLNRLIKDVDKCIALLER